jgi:hypothetical protein
MKDLKLPKFDIPDLPQKRLTAEAYEAWVIANVKCVRETARYEYLRNDSTRIPVGKRFVLK